MFSPLYDDWAREYGDKVKFLKVNAEYAEDIFRQFQIRVVPTLVILDEKGNVVRKSSGFHEISEVDKRLEKLKDNAVFTPMDFR